MIDEKTLVQNQYMKIHSLDVEKSPINYFFYSNGVNVLFIKKGKTKFLLCGIQTGFHVLYRQSSFDVYGEYDDLKECVKNYERFINLMLFPRKFEFKPEIFYERELI